MTVIVHWTLTVFPKILPVAFESLIVRICKEQRLWVVPSVQNCNFGAQYDWVAWAVKILTSIAEFFPDVTCQP